MPRNCRLEQRKAKLVGPVPCKRPKQHSAVSTLYQIDPRDTAAQLNSGGGGKGDIDVGLDHMQPVLGGLSFGGSGPPSLIVDHAWLTWAEEFADSLNSLGRMKAGGVVTTGGGTPTGTQNPRNWLNLRIPQRNNRPPNALTRHN